VCSSDLKLIDAKDIADLKGKLLKSGLSISQLVATAWASASTFRGTDKRGGANGGRIRLAPQKNWEANQPEELSKILGAIEKIQKEFNSSRTDGKMVSIADLIVLGGCAAVEEAAKKAGNTVNVSFSPGRADAVQEQTDVASFAVLEPIADPFRNFSSKRNSIPLEECLIEKACLLNLTAPEMTVLLGGMRVLNCNHGKSDLGVLTKRTETLTNDFFVHLLDMNVEWKQSSMCKYFYEGRDRTSGEMRWKGSAADLAIGSNPQLRALAEVYASDDAQGKVVQDFAAVWSKVMNLDRFDLA
jgi:catalase-peroxidase